VSFLIDTNILSAHARGDRRVFGRFQQYAGRLLLCAVTVGELTTWALRSPLIDETLASRICE
jgi:predicted nucleic acid-binding protein